MAVRPVDPQRLRRGRWVTLLVVAVALAASPTVTPLLSRLAHPVVTAPPLPDLRDVPSTLPDVQRYAAFVQPFQQALTELQVGERRRVTLSETHYALYLHAAPLLGANRTAALMELVSTEIRNQNPGRARRQRVLQPGGRARRRARGGCGTCRGRRPRRVARTNCRRPRPCHSCRAWCWGTRRTC